MPVSVANIIVMASKEHKPTVWSQLTGGKLRLGFQLEEIQAIVVWKGWQQEGGAGCSDREWGLAMNPYAPAPTDTW